MKDSTIAFLENTFGKGTFVADNIPGHYSYDESTTVSADPEALFMPVEQREIEAFVKIAKEHRIPVIPRGAGTGVCGGCVAVSGGVVLSLERMNRILDIDEKNMCVTVEAGVCNGYLKTFLEGQGYYYPPDPQSYDTSSIGGNIATNAGGPRAIRYGTTRDYIMSLELVDGRGMSLVTGGRVYKYASGYNLNEIFCGSEGTLGIVMKSTLRILPSPGERTLALVPFRTLENAVSFLRDVQVSHVDFSAVEFMDDMSKQFSERFLDRKLPYSDISESYLFVELESADDRALVRLEEAAVKNGGHDIFVSRDRAQEARLWEARKEVSHAFKAFSRHVHKADVVVPRGGIAALVREIKNLARQDLPVACFGHVGDGNVHVNILDVGGNRSSEAALMMNGIMDAVKVCGGFPSGEHGIGVVKKGFLKKFFSEYHINIWKQIKNVFDPEGIMNPGKIFDQE